MEWRSARALAVAEEAGPVATVFVASVVVVWWRCLSWPASGQADAWAYSAWGQALGRGQRPLYDQALTTPKPLGLVLGLIVSPVSPPRAFQAAVAVFLGVLAAALFWGAF